MAELRDSSGISARPLMADPALAMDMLDSALKSSQFIDAPRQSALLRYLVCEELGGRGEALSAYSIAFDVFGRDSSFNPAIDSIVRVEMHRLRQNIKTWNAASDNRFDMLLDIPPRSYRPRLVAKRAAEPAEAVGAVRRGLRAHHWAMAGAVLLLSVGLWMAITQYRHTLACRSARPELGLPLVIANLSPDRSTAMINRLKEMLGYYPLVTGGDHGFSECAGVPQYELAAAVSGSQLNLTLTARPDGKVLQLFDVPFDPSGSAGDMDIAAARTAFQLGYDAGYVANDALRRSWGNQRAQEQFNCLMSAHQYYYANAGPSIYASVRACLIKEFRKASMADVPAMLAAIELEPRFNPDLQKFQDHNYYSDAIAVAGSIDKFSAELIVAQLRALRLKQEYKRGDAQLLIATLDKVYPFEPYIRNQLAINQCKVTQEYEDGYKNIELYKKIIMADVYVPYAEIYCNIASGRVENNKPYFGKTLNDSSPYIQMLNLYLASKLEDKPMERQVIARLHQLNCVDRSCLLEILTEVKENPDIYEKLRLTIDRYFPDGTAVIDRAAAAKVPGGQR